MFILELGVIRHHLGVFDFFPAESQVASIHYSSKPILLYKAQTSYLSQTSVFSRNRPKSK